MKRLNCLYSISFIALLLFCISGFFISIPEHTVFAADTSALIEITGSANPPGFLPALLTVHVGESVTFLNVDPSSVSHTLTTTDNSFTSPSIAAGKEWTVVFKEVGSHEYP